MNFSFDPQPLTIEGAWVRLEPLAPHHAEALFAAGRDPLIWRYLPQPPFQSVAATQNWIGEALATQASGTQLSFATVLRATGTAIGSTRYLDIARPHRSLEIGWTWLTPQYQRTAVNTECKYLLLRHAFETLGAVRVQLKTDRRNEQSQRAIERLGAVREGVLRKHLTLWDGYVRDTVLYSIIDTEWPDVQRRLEEKIINPR